MIKRNFKNSAVAALMASAMLIGAGSASATVVDLINGNSGTINGGVFQFTQPQPTGTGVIQPFLRVQNDPAEQGYNTSGGTPFDDKAGPWTHNIQFSDLQASTVSMNGTTYFKLLLDVNEPNGAKSTISLDQLQFYTSSQGSQTTTNVSSLGTLRYTFGSGDQVNLDASRNHGSGSGDMYAYIPTSAFAGTNANDYVYMYVKFGNSDYTSAGGFEEWAIVNNMTPVPEMSALFPILGLMVAVLSTNVLRRRRMARMSA
jgi:hypothetical protein